MSHINILFCATDIIMAIITESVGSSAKPQFDNAILLQGPFYANKTQQYIDYYLENNPKSIIILSTFRDKLSTNFIDNYKNDRLYALFVTIENDSIILKNNNANKNFQRITTYYGLSLALQLGIKFTLKSRTDCVFAMPNIMTFFNKYLNHYEKPFTCASDTNSIKNRIIIPDCGTFVNDRSGPFHIADHWMYGATCDLVDYFTLDPYIWNKGENYRSNVYNTPPTSQSDYGSLWVHASNINVKNTLELVGMYFIVINNEDCKFIFKHNVLCDSSVDIIAYWKKMQNENQLITANMWFMAYHKIFSCLKLYDKTAFYCSDVSVANNLTNEKIKNIVVTHNENNSFDTFVNMLMHFSTSSNNFIVLCENNLTIKKYIRDDLCKILYFMKKYDYDIILLGYLLNNHEYLNKSTRFIKNHQGFDFYSYGDDLWGSHMFILSRNSAANILKFIEKNNKTKHLPNSADWIFTKIGKRALIYPPLAISNEKTNSYYVECYNYNIKHFESAC